MGTLSDRGSLRRLYDFSTFSKEALVMLQSGNLWGFVGYIALSVVIGIALVALGYFLVR